MADSKSASTLKIAFGTAFGIVLGAIFLVVGYFALNLWAEIDQCGNYDNWRTAYERNPNNVPRECLKVLKERFDMEVALKELEQREKDEIAREVEAVQEKVKRDRELAERAQSAEKLRKERADVLNIRKEARPSSEWPDEETAKKYQWIRPGRDQ